MLILGIESSCDDTSIALVKQSDTGFEVVRTQSISQIDVHRAFGGVVPEIAGRKHAEAIAPLIEQTLEGIRPDLIAVTSGPGLVTGLLVGVEAAKVLSFLWGVPVVGVNHISGHVHSVCITHNSDNITRIDFPAVCLVVSGGHTELLLMKSHTEFELLGKTRDDAAGETFDKAAKMLGLPYPGGPEISKLAAAGNSDAIKFPRPMLDDESCDMSFAGLKTAIRYWLEDNTIHDVDSRFRGNDKEVISLADVCASIEQAIVDVLVEKTRRAISKHNPKSLLLSGGVSANKTLREALLPIAPNTNYLLPDAKFTMDNGAMISVAGYFQYQTDTHQNWRQIQANPNWKVYDKN